jgi:hypothetical protein
MEGLCLSRSEGLRLSLSGGPESEGVAERLIAQEGLDAKYLRRLARDVTAPREGLPTAALSPALNGTEADSSMIAYVPESVSDR